MHNCVFWCKLVVIAHVYENSMPRHNVNSLSGAYLLRRPGITSVLEALKLYRERCCNGLVSPSEAFASSPKWMDGGVVDL